MGKIRVKKVPFVFRFIENEKEREKELKNKQSSCFYDEKESVTMIKVKNIKTPLVISDLKIGEIRTKTRVKREGDDYNTDILNVETRTARRREDNDYGLQSLELELQTKTFKSKESDDFTDGKN